ERDVLERESIRALALDRDQEIPLLRPFARRVRARGHDRKIEADERYQRLKAAPGRPFTGEAPARAVAPVPAFAHRLPSQYAAPETFRVDSQARRPPNRKPVSDAGRRVSHADRSSAHRGWALEHSPTSPALRPTVNADARFRT